MVNVRVPPYTGNEELDVYLRDLTDLLEEFNLTAVTAGVTTSNALEENLSSGTIVVGGDIYGYRYNNLAIRYSTTSNGAENFSDSIAVLPPTTTTFYVGLRSTPDTVESNNPADYTWVQASPTWNINLRLYYRVTGGKQFDYIIASTNPNPQAYAEDTGEFVNLSLVTAVEMIEITAGRGADGVDGTDGRSTANLSIYIRNSDETPATPTGGSYNFSTNTITAPTNWSASIPSGSGDLYISQSIASIEGSDGTDNDLTWSAPVLFVESVINGADGFSLFEASIYRRATATPATPTGGSYNFGTNTLTAPTDWSDDIPDGSNPVYRSTGLFEVQGNTGTDSTVTWTAPKLFVQDGGTGDPGNDGTSTYRANIYIQQSTAPDTPSGGSFNFTTNTLTVPTGWQEDIPETTTTGTYISTGLFSISGDEGTDNSVTWSSPVLYAQLPLPAMAYATLDYDDAAAFTLTANVVRPLTNWDTAGDYSFWNTSDPSVITISSAGIVSSVGITTVPEVNSSTTALLLEYPGEEEEGNDSLDKLALDAMQVDTIVKYIDNNDSEIQWSITEVNTQVSGDDIFYLLYLSHISGEAVQASGDDTAVQFILNPQLQGPQGESGLDGTDATRSTTGLVYFTTAQENAPASPSATSYNFTTGVFTGLTSNWQTSPVTVNVTSTTDLYWRSRYLITEATLDGTQTITFTTPTSSINFGDDIQSDNFVTESEGWQIQRDSGNAEFNNVTIRGESTVDTTTIGGTAVLRAIDTSGFSSSSILSDNNRTITTIRESYDIEPTVGVNRFIMPRFGTVAVSSTFANFIAGNATSADDFDTDAVLRGYYIAKVYDEDDSEVLSLNSDTETVPDYGFSGFNSSGQYVSYFIQGSSADYPEWAENSFEVLSNYRRIEISIVTKVSSDSNWDFNVSSGTGGGIIFPNGSYFEKDKETDAASYLAANDVDNYAALIEGGLGLRVPPALVFSGSAVNFAFTEGDFDREASMYIVQVHYANSNINDKDTLNNTIEANNQNQFILMQAAINPHSYKDTSELDSFSNVSASSSHMPSLCVPVYDNENNLVTTIVGNQSFTYTAATDTMDFQGFDNFEIDNTGQASNISGVTIRAIWRRMQ